MEGLGEEQIEKLIAGLQRAIGQEASVPEFLFARNFGHVHALGGSWDALGLSAVLDQCHIAGRSTAAVFVLVKLLVVNRLCYPCSKLDLLDWLDGVYYPEQEPPSYHQLLQAMDRLIGIRERTDPAIARRLMTTGDRLDLVFYDITSTSFGGERSLAEDDFRRYGYSRDHRPDRRETVIGMVMTKEGIPLCHQDNRRSEEGLCRIRRSGAVSGRSPVSGPLRGGLLTQDCRRKPGEPAGAAQEGHRLDQ
jgi:hypothetical protein